MITLRTIDGKEVQYKEQLAQISDTIKDAYEADKTQPINVIFDEKVALTIKRYLEDHDYD